MVKPGNEMEKCPVCGAKLTRETIDQFDVPVGYSLTCDHCLRYSDIWVNGLREIQCGEWYSPDFESNYGKATWKEKQILLQLQFRLLWERLKYMKVRFREKRLYGTEFDAPSQTEYVQKQVPSAEKRAKCQKI